MTPPFSLADHTGIREEGSIEGFRRSLRPAIVILVTTGSFTHESATDRFGLRKGGTAEQPCEVRSPPPKGFCIFLRFRPKAKNNSRRTTRQCPPISGLSFRQYYPVVRQISCT